MRYLFSILVLALSMSFFIASCGGDDGNADNSCSPSNPTGTCEDGKVCKNGMCVKDEGSCTPDCSGKVCGDDGCGGTCGTCNAGETCDANGQCQAGNNACSPSNPNGTCEAGKVCKNGHCVDDNNCTPDCNGKVCGDDGCGGTCGTCNAGETCNANGQCQASSQPNPGELGGSCDQNTPCVDQDAMCLTASGVSSCYQSCNGANDTSCRQDGAVCMDTGNAQIGWICVPPAPPGNTPIGGDCSQENCVAEATCGTVNNVSTCYENCTGEGYNCQLENHVCANTSIGWLCIPQAQPGNTPIGGDCSQENCVAEAICLNPDAPTCYEKCDSPSYQCSQSNYKCIDSGNAQIGWVCWPQVEPGNTPIGGDCSGAADDPSKNCVAGAACLSTQDENGNITSSICYEECDTNNGGTCSQQGYTCQSIPAGSFCLPQQ